MTNEHENGLEWHAQRAENAAELLELMAGGLLSFTLEELAAVRESWAAVLLDSVCPALEELAAELRAGAEKRTKTK